MVFQNYICPEIHTQAHTICVSIYSLCVVQETKHPVVRFAAAAVCLSFLNSKNVQYVRRAPDKYLISFRILHHSRSLAHFNKYCANRICLCSRRLHRGTVSLAISLTIEPATDSKMQRRCRRRRQTSDDSKSVCH